MALSVDMTHNIEHVHHWNNFSHEDSIIFSSTVTSADRY